MGDELTDEDLREALEAARASSMAGQDLAKTVTTDHAPGDWTTALEPSREGESLPAARWFSCITSLPMTSASRPISCVSLRIAASV